MTPTLPLMQTSQQGEEERLWTADDVARFLGVHPKTVRKMNVPRTFIETTQNSRRRIVRYIPAEVKEWAAARSTARFTSASQKRAS